MINVISGGSPKPKKSKHKGTTKFARGAKRMGVQRQTSRDSKDTVDPPQQSGQPNDTQQEIPINVESAPVAIDADDDAIKPKEKGDVKSKPKGSLKPKEKVPLKPKEKAKISSELRIVRGCTFPKKGRPPKLSTLKVTARNGVVELIDEADPASLPLHGADAPIPKPYEAPKSPEPFTGPKIISPAQDQSPVASIVIRIKEPNTQPPNIPMKRKLSGPIETINFEEIGEEPIAKEPVRPIYVVKTAPTGPRKKIPLRVSPRFNQVVRPHTNYAPIAPLPVMPTSPLPVISYAQREIIIDGSEQPNPKPNTSTCYITQKKLEGPIFLGKNKIVLTNIKFPPHIKNKDLPATSPIKVHPHQMPPTTPTTVPFDDTNNLLLPGMKLILLPDGNLSFSLEPGYDLTEEQIASLPAIFESVQSQLNINVGNVVQNSTTNEVVDISGDDEAFTVPIAEENEHGEKSDTTVNVTGLNEISSGTPLDGITPIVNLQNSGGNDGITDGSVEPNAIIPNSDGEKEIVHNTSLISHNTDSTASVVAIDQVTGDITQETSIAIPNKDSEEHALVLEPSNEVSDVLAEDIAADAVIACELSEGDQVCDVDTEEKEDETVKSKPTARNLLSDLMEMSGILDEDMAPVAPEPQPNLQLDTIIIDPDPEIPKINEPIVVTSGPPQTPANTKDMSLAELSPVTSLTELKYACEKGGLFFKLDLETGFVVAINVKLKRSRNVNKRNPNFDRTTPTVTGIVDLTDDRSDEVEGNTIEAPEKLPISPVEETPKAKSRKIMIKKTSLLRTSLIDDAVKPIKLYRVRRPPEFVKSKLIITADKYGTHLRSRKQDLNKDVLLKESDADEIQANDSNNTASKNEADDMDDSSDDEPLAALVKRRNERAETPTEGPTTDDIQIQGSPSEDAMEIDSEEPLGTYMDEEVLGDEDSNEDCILGF